MDWLGTISERQMSLVSQAEECQVAYGRRSGWLWRFSRNHRKWIKRWAIFDSKTNSFSFFESPSQREAEGKRSRSKQIKSVTIGRNRLLKGDSKIFGLNIETVNGKQIGIACSTPVQRSDWIDFLTGCISSEVTLHQRYDMHWNCLVGSGSYADVVLATEKSSGKHVAVKMVTTAACQKHFELMDKEVQIMSLIGNYPYLLGLNEAFYSEDHIFIVSEFLAGGDLESRLRMPSETFDKNLGEDKARIIFKELLLAVDRLHELGISHCDLKPQNILFTSREHDAHVKLTDYNSATFFCDPTEPGGTPEYMAPELIAVSDDSSSSGWDSALDMWALGVLLFWMLCGFSPFYAETVPEILHNVQAARFEWPSHVDLSEDVKDLISHLLQKDPNLRPTAEGALQHSWTKSEPALKPLLTIMADTRSLLPSLVLGSEEIEPNPVPCTILNSATIAAMSAQTPSHLCIKVPQKGCNISYGFAANMSQANESEEVGLVMEMSGLEVADSLLSLDCPSPLELLSPASRDPMDSCMSVHRDLSFRESDTDSITSPAKAIEPHKGEPGHCRPKICPEVKRQEDHEGI